MLSPLSRRRPPLHRELEDAFTLRGVAAKLINVHKVQRSSLAQTRFAAP